MRKSGPFRIKTTMDAERINLIGTQLADLASRTQALRGYL
jgi:hypothetical protein